MAKGATQETTKRAENLGDQSTAALTGALSGGGAFGGPGLTADYNKSQERADQSRSTAQGAVGNLNTTGGFDPTQLAKTRGVVSNIQTTGGYDPAAINFYKGMMGTGGYTGTDIGRFLNQATSGVTNTANVMQQKLRQQAAASGGTNQGAAIAQMARHLGQDQATTTTDALAKIHEQQIANEFKGAGGLGDVATGIRQGAALGTQLEGDVAHGVQTGAQLSNQLYNTDTGRITDQGNMILKMFGIDTSNQQVALNALSEMAKRPGLLDNILRIADTISPFKTKDGSSAGPSDSSSGDWAGEAGPAQAQ